MYIFVRIQFYLMSISVPFHLILFSFCTCYFAIVFFVCLRFVFFAAFFLKFLFAVAIAAIYKKNKKNYWTLLHVVNFYNYTNLFPMFLVKHSEMFRENYFYSILLLGVNNNSTQNLIFFLNLIWQTWNNKRRTILIDFRIFANWIIITVLDQVETTYKTKIIFTEKWTATAVLHDN